ncbi:TonB-dependent receptor [Aureimonas endophytica]|uniref:TonB-dependent receptor n=1 Tax=Aureimonas endophytica TaxID=2027858 RepID=A0A916ZRA6_9HYPH|nr:TonB-dependent siderophore receptor [Aureimonas endophytica]GGE09111.1 TonB-dependent receptor [Aureimonas endophytica]
MSAQFRRLASSSALPVALFLGLGLAPKTAFAQQAIELDTVTIDAAAGEAGTANGQGDGTGAGEANEQQGFVARRSAGATKTNTPLIETPQAVSVVTSDQIEEQDARTLRAATRYTAGVTPEITGGSDTRCGGFNIRGFDSTANSTFIDGLRLPSTSVINFLCLDPYGAERVEILKGPSSVLYGQNGPGGLINYVQKKPTDAPLREVEVSGGSFGMIEGRFDLAGPFRKDSPWSFRLTGTARTGENQVDHVDDDRLFIAPALRWEPDADTSLTVLGNYQRDRAGWGLQFMPASGTVYDNNGRRIPRSRFLGEPDFDYYDTDMGSAGWEFSTRLTDVFTLRQNARYAGVRHDEASVYGGGYLDEAAGILGRSGGTGIADLDTFSVDNQVQAEFATGILQHTLLGGVDYRYTGYTDRIDIYSASPLNVFDPVYGNPVDFLYSYTDRRVDQNQTGFYLQDQIKIDKLSILLSGREDFASTEARERLTGGEASKDYDAFTGRVGLIYNFDSGFAPYLTYSESFLPPLDTSATGELFAPETGRLYEGGIKYQPPGWNASVTASVFEIVRNNAIRYDAVGGTFQPRQTGQITSRGFELEGAASLTDSLDLRLAYTYLDAEITRDPDGGFEGTVPTTIPRNSVSAWANYTIHNETIFDGLGAGLGLRYVGESYGDDANSFKVPGATVVDAALSYKKDNWELSVNASNLFDKDYVASCGNKDFYCFYGEGRRITGKAAIRW